MSSTVVVAMSGGVDSSVAAALLVEQGYRVIGVTLDVWPRLQAGNANREDACCSLAAVDDARAVADRLGIAHYTLNFRDVFERTVIRNFVDEYARGRTPNPCIRCNEHVKFDALLRRAIALGADYVATGHYARVQHDASSGRHLLIRGVDSSKDQSYALYALRQEQLAHTLFPLGGFLKAETRAMATERSLPVADKPDSQEICFVADNDYAGFLRNSAGLEDAPGRIVHVDGRTLGQHQGLFRYTIGQRRGLGVATGAPLFVVGIDPARNQVIVGPEEALLATTVIAEDVNLISVDCLTFPLEVTAKIRYRAPESPAVAKMVSDERIEVSFSLPQRAPAPGQALVLYVGDVVLGGGTIARAE